MIIVTRIVSVPADDNEDADIEVAPSVHLTDESALAEIARIQATVDNWAAHELMPTGKTRLLAIMGSPAKIVRS